MTTPDRFLVAAAGVALMAAALGVWLLIAPAAEPAFDAGTDAVAFAHEASVPASPADKAKASGSAVASDLLVIDVEGGVSHPGIVKLRAGSRVADAIVAAGGYSAEADLLAASQINLAALLSDGQQVLVPLRNATPSTGATAGAAAAAGGGRGSGLVNLNQATPEQLDALPGIGPVTVQKIVAARQERPFGSLDELVDRKVLTNSQLEKIRAHVTVG